MTDEIRKKKYEVSLGVWKTLIVFQHSAALDTGREGVQVSALVKKFNKCLKEENFEEARAIKDAYEWYNEDRQRETIRVHEEVHANNPKPDNRIETGRLADSLISDAELGEEDELFDTINYLIEEYIKANGEITHEALAESIIKILDAYENRD